MLTTTLEADRNRGIRHRRCRRGGHRNRFVGTARAQTNEPPNRNRWPGESGGRVFVGAETVPVRRHRR